MSDSFDPYSPPATETDRDARGARTFGQTQRPDRGPTILLLGISGIICSALSLCCGLFSVAGLGLGAAAWILGRRELLAIDTGEATSIGRADARKGMICGTIATILAALLLLLQAVFFIAVMMNTEL